MESTLILAIKPESLITKVAVYKNSEIIFLKSINHSPEELDEYLRIADQFEVRSKQIIEELEQANVAIEDIKIVIGRGGLLKPMSSGVFEVNQRMRDELIHSRIADHHINLGGLIASYIAKRIEGARALIANPVVVDELDEIARYSGLPNFKRNSIFHALSHKSIARKFAKSQNREYEDLNLIVGHLGDGTSIGAHKDGKVIDVNQAFDGEGPFSFERAGSIPLREMIELCFSGFHTEEQLVRLIQNEGGMTAYFGTSSRSKIEKMIENGNSKAAIVYEAMAYQVSKYIGSLVPVLFGKIDAILLTGSLVQSKMFVNWVQKRVESIAPVHIFPDEHTVKNLAMYARLVLNDEMKIQEYV